MLGTSRIIATLAASAVLVACSGGDGGTNPTPAIAIALSANTLSVTQGTTGSITVSLTRSGGFTGDVALTLEGLPTGVVFTATPPSLGSSVSSSVITIGAGGAANPATTNLTVRATGTGVTAQTVTLALTVVAAPAQSFSIAAAPTAATVTQGGNVTSTITLTRTGGFAGNVALAAEGLPTGVTPAFNPTSFTGTATTSTLTLTAGATATTGPATITVRGTSTGQTDKTATIQLTVNAAVSGGYTLGMNPATLSVQQGANGTSTVNITRTGGFAGSVNLTASGLPNGVTAVFNPTDATGNTSTLTLTASPTAATGAATVTIKGTATGLADQTTTLALTVTAAPVGGYTLGLTPATLTVQQGTSGTSTVNITRTNGFAGAVTLAATGLPNGVTAAFNPTAPTGNTSTLTLTASPTATTGAATVTIRGTATGLTDQTTTLALTVSPAVGGSGNTTWEFCTVADLPLWFAVQDGANGTWTRVTPTGTKFQFNITQPKAGIAFVTPTASAASRSFASRLSTQLRQELLLRNRPTGARAYASSAVDAFALSIFYGTQAELSGQGTLQCVVGSTGGKTVNGTVAGLSPTQTATISLGSASAGASGANTAFQITDVPDGALDLIAARTTINTTTFSFATDKLIIRRGVDAANNSTLPVLDFAGADAFDPVQPNLTINNLGTDVAAPFTFYFTSAGSGSTGAFFGLTTPTAAPFKYSGVPAAKQAAGDLHMLLATALPSPTTTDQSRFAALFFKDATDRTVTLGAALAAPTVTTAATTPYARLRVTGALGSYTKFLSLDFSQSNTTLSRNVSITATEGYLAGSANYDFTIPDFSGVAGWDNNWGPKTGIAGTLDVNAYTFAGIGFGSATPTEGATFQGARREISFTP